MRMAGISSHKVSIVSRVGDWVVLTERGLGWGYLITAEALSWSMPMEQMIKDLVAGLQRINRKMTERPPNRLSGYRRPAPMGGFQGKVRR
jgi:hypothetical protein